MKIDVKSWTMSAPTDVKDSEIVVSLDGQQLGAFPVDNTIGGVTELNDNYGTAAISSSSPRRSPPAATSQLTLTGAQHGTSVIVPLTIDQADSTTVGVPNKMFANSKGNGVIQYDDDRHRSVGTPVDG